MTDSLVTSIVTVLMAIIGVAILAVLVSKQSQTTQVINAGASGFANVLQAAYGPLGGSGTFGRTFTGGGVQIPSFQ